MNLEQMRAELSTTEAGSIALWILEGLAADCADSHTNFVRVNHANHYYPGEASFEVDVCDPDRRYRIRVDDVHKIGGKATRALDSTCLTAQAYVYGAVSTHP